MRTYPGGVLGVPYTPPPVPRDPWTGARMYMRDRWGIRWSFCGPRGTGVRMQSGVRGLGMPAYTRFSTPYAGLAGSRHRGSRAVDREVYWPLWIWQDTDDQAWLDYDSSFWRTMDPEEVVTWEVEQPNGTVRYLDVRFDNDSNVAFEKAPGMRKWVPYGVYLIAEQPYWRGDPIYASWGSTFQPTPFFGGPGEPGGPPLYISSDAILSEATVTNPGDVPGWPEYKFTGAFTGIEVTLDGFTIEYNGAMDADDVLVISTDPTKQGAFLNGVRITSSLARREYAPIPKLSTVPLTINVAGSGKVEMTFTPLFKRAW